jgi:hypothetical protein
MKRLILTTAATVLATAAFAQDNGAYRASGQRAGGPAYLTNSETGGAVKPIRGTSRPKAYRYSGHHGGGPANDAIVQTGPVSVQGTVYDPARIVPFGTARSGHTAGGPTRH